MGGKFEFVWLTRDRESVGIDPPASEESTVLTPTHDLRSVHLPSDEQPPSVCTLGTCFA